jgi:hypothetical protein
MISRIGERIEALTIPYLLTEVLKMLEAKDPDVALVLHDANRQLHWHGMWCGGAGSVFPMLPLDASPAASAIVTQLPPRPSGNCLLRVVLVVMEKSEGISSGVAAVGGLEMRAKCLVGGGWTSVRIHGTDTVVSLAGRLVHERASRGNKVGGDGGFELGFTVIRNSAGIAEAVACGGQPLAQLTDPAHLHLEPFLRCPSGHTMEVLWEKPPAYRGGVLCDFCRSSVRVEQGLLHCRRCQSDVCFTCTKMFV